MENMNLKDFAEYIHSLGRHCGDIRTCLFEGGDTDNTMVLVPDGMQLVNVSDTLPKYPRFKHENRRLVDVASFIAYFNEQKSPFSRIFAQLSKPPYCFEGIIDYHATAGNTPNWCHHRVTLALDTTDQFKHWVDHSGATFSQDEFTEFLKDHRFDITAPDNSQLLELIMHLEATRECRAEGSVRTNRGMTLSYTEITTAHRGDSVVEVPDMLTITVPMFQGGEEIAIQADFKFRIRDGRICFSYRLLNVERSIRAAVSAIRDRIAKETETPVYL